jgi:hypothetical protein
MSLEPLQVHFFVEGNDHRIFGFLIDGAQHRDFVKNPLRKKESDSQSPVGPRRSHGDRERLLHQVTATSKFHADFERLFYG